MLDTYRLLCMGFYGPKTKDRVLDIVQAWGTFNVLNGRCGGNVRQ